MPSFGSAGLVGGEELDLSSAGVAWPDLMPMMKFSRAIVVESKLGVEVADNSGNSGVGLVFKLFM